MKIGAWLLTMMEPLLARILVSLGFSVVSITGMTVVTDQLKTQAQSGLGLLSSETLSLFSLVGGPEALGIIFGACTTKLLLWGIMNNKRLLGVNPAS